LLALGLAALFTGPARAQGREVFPGDRVRVTQDGRWTGFVQAVDSDSIHVIPDGEERARSIALVGLERLELSLGTKSRGRPFLIGGLGGAGLGAGAAAVISARHTCEMDPDQFGFTPFCETVGPVAIVASTVAGFAVGGAVGALFGGGENWVRAVMPGGAASSLPARIGAIRVALQLGRPAP
jgi:hypothetical protein